MEFLFVSSGYERDWKQLYSKRVSFKKQMKNQFKKIDSKEIQQF